MRWLEGYRIPLDPSLPLVASQAFTSGDRSFGVDDLVDWRAMGATEIDVGVWWRGGLVEHPRADALAESELEKLTAPTVPIGAVLDPGGEKRTFVIDGKSVELTSGPTINVATPEQQALRAQRKKR